MTWWHFVQLIILVLFLSLMITVVIESIIKTLYNERTKRDIAEDNRRGITVFKGSSDS